MTCIAVEISRFVDAHQPGFVECTLVDAGGTRHFFLEKLPVVTSANLWSGSNYPQPGVIACEVKEEWLNNDGKALAKISTEQPFGVESNAGLTSFVVLQAQLQR